MSLLKEASADSRGFTEGQFVEARAKAWLVESVSRVGTLTVADLVSIEDDSQGETLRLVPGAELGARRLDPDDWSPLLRATFEGPDRLGAYLRATEWRSATAADRKLFQAPFDAMVGDGRMPSPKIIDRRKGTFWR